MNKDDHNLHLADAAFLEIHKLLVCEETVEGPQG